MKYLKVFEDTNDDNCDVECKKFAEWLRHTCVISSDEGYYYEDGETYSIDEIYKIYKGE